MISLLGRIFGWPLWISWEESMDSVHTSYWINSLTARFIFRHTPYYSIHRSRQWPVNVIVRCVSEITAWYILCFVYPGVLHFWNILLYSFSTAIVIINAWNILVMRSQDRIHYKRAHHIYVFQQWFYDHLSYLEAIHCQTRQNLDINSALMSSPATS